MALVVVGAGAFAWATTPVPSLQANALVATTTVYFADGETVMGELNNGGIDRKPLEATQMPAVAKQAAVASEDRTFFQNKGVSVTGLGRAVWGVVTGNPNLGGGSTITQQYVKNITGNDQRAYTRKATEAIQALKVDQQYEKDEILTSYLNTVYFGRGAYGIGAAAEAYFGQPDASQLTAPQAALLIGILPAPSAWDPALDPDNAQKRYSYVMGAMQEMGSLSAADVAANPTMPEVVVQEKPQWQTGTNGYLLQTVVDEVKGIGGTGLTVELVDGSRKTLTTGDDVASAGLKIVSTIDKPKQDAAVAAVDDKDNFPDRNRPETVRAGLVSIDPATGGVVAMYGGPDISNPAYAYNAVTQAKAQAGSTFKPITLLAALDDENEDISLSSTFNGRSPQTFAGAPIKNFGRGNGEQFGNINLVQATAKSVNTAYMELNEEIGPETTAKTAEALGVEMDPTAQTAVSNVLGSSSVRPIEMAQAYAALANGGTVRKAHTVKAVTGGDNTYFLENPKDFTEPFSKQAVADTVYAMQAVTKSGGTAPAVGKAFGNRPIAGKTGTTNQNRAAWFNGFTPQLQATVVLFNPGPAPDYEEQPLGSWGGVEQVTGGTFPSKIWTAYMKDALGDSEIEQFAKPSRQVSASPSPTATATPTPTETATAEPSESPSEGTEPTEDGDGQDQPGENGDGGDGQQGDEPAVAAGPAGGVLERAAAIAQGGPGQGRGGGQQAPAAGPGRG